MIRLATASSSQTFLPKISGRSGMPLALLVTNFSLNITRNIADTQKRGHLDFKDFALGMYLIQAIQSGQLSSVPPSIPTHIFEQIATLAQNSSPPIPEPPITPPPIPEKPPPPKSPSFLSPPKTDRSRSFPLDTHYIDHWDVSPAERLDSDVYYDALDPNPSGYVEGDVAAKFLLKYKLPPEDLAHIWYVSNKFCTDQVRNLTSGTSLMSTTITG